MGTRRHRDTGNEEDKANPSASPRLPLSASSLPSLSASPPIRVIPSETINRTSAGDFYDSL
jgi:hypothetical protein